MRIYNVSKTIFLLIFNTALFGISMYYCFLFNVIWTEWITQLIIIWIFIVLGDFIIFEIAFEILLLILACLGEGEIKAKIREFFFALKNLRNLY